MIKDNFRYLQKEKYYLCKQLFFYLQYMGKDVRPRVSAALHYAILSRGQIASKSPNFFAPLPHKCKRFTLCDIIMLD